MLTDLYGWLVSWLVVGWWSVGWLVFAWFPYFGGLKGRPKLCRLGRFSLGFPFQRFLKVPHFEKYPF